MKVRKNTNKGTKRELVKGKNKQTKKYEHTQRHTHTHTKKRIFGLFQNLIDVKKKSTKIKFIKFHFAIDTGQSS